MEPNVFNDDNRKHFDFLQSIITRMNSNSFLIKGWTVTLVAALLALLASTKEWRFVLVTLLPIVLFWLLDARYLLQERKFRALYNEAIKGQNSIIPYSMDISIPSIKNNGKNQYFKVAFSKTMLFYLCLFFVTILVCLLFKVNKPVTPKVENFTRIKFEDTLSVKLTNKELRQSVRIDSSK